MTEAPHMLSLRFCSHPRAWEVFRQSLLALLRRLSLILVAFLPLIALSTTTSAADKKVLFMYGDRSNGMMVGYREVVQANMRAGSPDRITFFEEYMDLSQHSGDEYLSLLRNFYRQKYQGQRFDLIIAQAGSVLNFLTKYGEELFPGTPTVFGTLEKSRIEGVKLGPNITGILIDAGFGATLEAALRMQPDVRKVVVVSGASEIDAKNLAKAQAQFHSYEGRVEFTYLTGLPMEELEKRLANLAEHTIIFYISLYRDGAGQAFALLDSVARIARASNAPIYSVIDRLIEVGSIGGFVLSMEADGREVAKVALRVLAGEKPADIPIRVADTNRYMFDWRQLRRWNIDERRLPPGSVLMFREATFWEFYRWHIVGVFALCVLEALLIAVLLFERRRHKRTGDELQKTRNDLAHVARVTAMGEMAASIAHEVNQPLAAIATYGDACVRLLSGESPNVKKSLEAIDHIISDSMRASEVIKRVRALVKKTAPENTPQDLNQIILEMVALTDGDVMGKSVQRELRLAPDLPLVLGDRVELQQVVLNLILNGIEAMSAITDRARQLTITSSQTNAEQVLVAVQDSGVGMNSELTRHIFEPFVTTKPNGLGMGLSISRTILEAHGGRLWAEPNEGLGAKLQFTLPVAKGSNNGH